MSDLLKKLQSMGLKVENGSSLTSEPGIKIPIDRVVKGDWIESKGERVFIARKFIPFGISHGNIAFENENRFESLAEFWGVENLNLLNLNDFIFIDTETSGLSLGTGSIIFLFGACFFEKGGLAVVQFFLEDPSSEMLFLANIDDLISKHKCLISYNGKSFDLPMLKSRLILNRMTSSNLERSHLDLLHFARRLWKIRLDSRRLSDIEREILEFQRTEDEVPGWLVPQIYQDYLSNGDASPLKGVFYHNENDVVSLAALFSHINSMVADEKALNSAHFLDILSIGSIYQKTGNLSLSEVFYKKGLVMGNSSELNNNILLDFARLLKKQKKWLEAVEIWRKLAQRNDPFACIELAKYFEHKESDLPTASVWVDTAIQICNGENGSKIKIEELIRRKNRLESKIFYRNEK